MAFDVSYVYRVIDKYSAPLDRIAKKTNAAREQFKKANKDVIDFGRGMRDFGSKASLFVSLPLILMGKSFIKAASDAEETRSKFATIFASMGQQSEAMADKLANDFGLAGTEARMLLGNTGDMLTGFGFSAEKAADLSLKVQELAVDLASFTNFSGGAKGASDALTKALLGERESVKSLGIAILEEDVKKRVALMRSKGMRFDTMRQAKAYATLAIATEQSKNAVGDYARTMNSFANRSRRLSGRLQDLKERLGVKLMPIAVKALEIFDGLITKFNSLSDNTQNVILIISGLAVVLFPLIAVIGALIMIIPLVGAAFAFILSPIGLAIAAISALIGFFIYATRTIDNFSQKVLTSLSSFPAVDGAIKVFGVLGGYIDFALSKMQDFISLIKFIPSGIGSAFAGAKDFFGSADSNIVAEERKTMQSNFSGEMTVRAEKGTEVTKTRATLGNMNLGVNVAGAR